MRSETVLRLSGVSLLAGGSIALAAHLLHPRAPQDASGAAAFLQATGSAHLVLFVGVLLVLLGLPGLWARHADGSGGAALAGAALLFAGLVCTDFIHCPVEFGASAALAGLPPEEAARIWTRTYSETPLARVQLIGAPLLAAGTILFLVGTRRAALAPRAPRVLLWAFPALLVGSFLPVVTHVAGMTFVLALYGALAAYGIVMLRGRAGRPA